eukprot:11477306-Alexandrium_andersonii.AAC.1
MHIQNGNGAPDSQRTLIMDLRGSPGLDSDQDDTQPALGLFVSAPGPNDPVAEFTQSIPDTQQG